MNVLVLNGGKYASIDGAVVRFKNLIVQNTDFHVTWAEPVIARQRYKTEDLDPKVPKNVTLLKGKKCRPDPLSEWWARENHFLHAAKNTDADVCVIYNAWGTRRAQRYLKDKGVPVVFDCIDFMHAFRRNPLERAVSRQATLDALRHASAVITTAHRLHEDALQYNAKSHLVPNGVDIDFFANAPAKKLKTPSVGFVGGFGDWLDFKKLAPAMEDLGIQFYFIGDGPAKSDLPKQENVWVSDGFLPQAQARRFVKSVDVCVIPFKRNALTDAVCPLKLFEYWAASKPVVVSPTYELKRIIRDEAAFADTEREWKDAITSLCHDGRARTRLGAKGFIRAKHYSWKTLSRRFVSILEDVTK